MSELDNFRKNFAIALEYDGRSLNRFHKDSGISLAYLSRVRSGTYGNLELPGPVPSITMGEQIASCLGYFLRDLLLPSSEFESLASAKKRVREEEMARMQTEEAERLKKLRTKANGRGNTKRTSADL